MAWVQVAPAWGGNVHVVLAGLTNTYSSYVTTFEEYGVQRYEGASTIFGPHTLDAYIQVPACTSAPHMSSNASCLPAPVLESLFMLIFLAPGLDANGLQCQWVKDGTMRVLQDLAAALLST